VKKQSHESWFLTLNNLFMKKLLILIPIFIACFGYAQQDPMYTQYILNQSIVNPALAGETDYINIFVLSRNQWLGIEGAPSTQVLGADLPINKSNAGFGTVIISDRLGPVMNNVWYFDYSYRLRINKKQYIAMGLRGGAAMYSANFSELYAVDTDDEYIAEDIQSKILANFGFGLRYKTENYYISLSIPKMLKNKLDSNGNQVSSNSRINQHFYLIGGYKLQINRNLIVEPGLVGKFVGGAPISFDISTSATFREIVTAGVLYRIGDAVGVLFQYNFNNTFKLGYAVDYSISSIGFKSLGSHEIMASYSIEPRKQLKIPFLDF